MRKKMKIEATMWVEDNETDLIKDTLKMDLLQKNIKLESFEEVAETEEVLLIHQDEVYPILKFINTFLSMYGLSIGYESGSVTSGGYTKLSCDLSPAYSNDTFPTPLGEAEYEKLMHWLYRFWKKYPSEDTDVKRLEYKNGDMMEFRSVQDFRKLGLLKFVNLLLQPLEFSLAVDLNEPDKLYFVQSKFNGFDSPMDYTEIRKYLKKYKEEILSAKL